MNAWRIEELVSLKIPPSEEDTDHNGLSDLIHFKTHKTHLSLTASPSNGVLRTCLHLQCHMLLLGRLPINLKGTVSSLFQLYAAFLKSVLLVCGRLQHKRLCVSNKK